MKKICLKATFESPLDPPNLKALQSRSLGVREMNKTVTVPVQVSRGMVKFIEEHADWVQQYQGTATPK